MISRRSIDGVLFLTLVTVIVTVTTMYVSQENTFYWWDYADYHNYAILVTDTFRSSVGEGWKFVRETLTQQKNALHVVPLLPFLIIGGNSRLAYILGIALTYFLPFSLAMGAIASSIVPTSIDRCDKNVLQPASQLSFWIAAFLTLLVPLSWVPLLRGYPDVGGVMLLGWASWLYLRNPRLSKIWQIVAMGSLLGLSILFRRHFAYGAISILVAAWLSQFSVKAWQQWLTLSLRLAAVALVSFVVLAGVAWEFTIRAMTTDYVSRYAVWSLPVSDIFWRIVSGYGWGFLIVALAGWILQIWHLQNSENYRNWLFVAIAGTVAMAISILKLRYGNLHYTLHLTPWFVLGCIGWIGAMQRRRLVLSLTGLYLFVNCSLGLGDVPQRSIFFFAKSHPPIERHDTIDLRRSIDRLRELTTPEDSIFVIGASNEFNALMLMDGELEMYGDDRRLNFLPVPILDGNISPVDTLLLADWVVLATPLQVIQPGDEQIVRSNSQNVVKVMFEAFSENWEITRDFQKIPESFQLDNGVVLSLYQRIRETSEKVEEQTRSSVRATLDFLKSDDSP
ncbi:MAG: hypothetical protein J7642_04440 [Cyanobacteria bacterium SBC]|nr:hypothetical protein [Cyanobacteria bacterium SBC]